MGPGAVSSSGLSYLTQAGGVLSNLPVSVSATELQSAAPRDVVSLSEEAIRAQVASGLFGTATSASTTGTNATPASLLQAAILGSTG